MKIIHIIYDSINNPWLNGGGAKRTHEIYKRLADQHQVIVICGNFRNANKNIDGVTYTHLGVGLNYPMSRLTFILCTYIYLLFHSADIFVEDLGVPFPLLTSKIKRNTIASVQFIPNESYKKKRGIIGKISTKLFTSGIKSYKTFFTVSEFASNFIRGINKNSEIIIIPNGISKIKKSVSKNKQNYILLLGRLDVMGKGIDTLIESIRELNDLKNLELIIAGSGEVTEIKKINNLITQHKLEDKIKLVGYVEGKEKDKLMKDCLFVVMPSLNETFGLAALEAFSYGKPVIGSSVGGLKDILESSNAALLTQPGNSKLLAKQIKELYLNKAKIERLSKNGLKYSTQFLWDNIASDYEINLARFIK